MKVQKGGGGEEKKVEEEEEEGAAEVQVWGGRPLRDMENGERGKKKRSIGPCTRRRGEKDEMGEGWEPVQGGRERGRLSELFLKRRKAKEEAT